VSGYCFVVWCDVSVIGFVDLFVLVVRDEVCEGLCIEYLYVGY